MKGTRLTDVVDCRSGAADRWYQPAVAGVVAGWGLLALATVDIRGWWFTELPTVHAGRLTFIDMLYDRAAHGHCPLYFSGSWLLQRIVGESTVWLRLPAVLAGMIALVLLARLARRMIGPFGSLMALLFFAAGPFLLHVSQLARPYSLVLVFGLMSLLVLAEGNGSVKGRRAVIFGVVTLLGLLTSHVYWFVFLAEIVWLVIRRRPRFEMVAGGLIGAIVSSIWVLFTFYFVPERAGELSLLPWIPPLALDSVIALPGRLFFGIEPFALPRVGLGTALLSLIVLVPATIGSIRLIRQDLGSAEGEGSLIVVAGIGSIVVGLVAGLLGWGNLAWVPRYFIISAACMVIVMAAGCLRLRLFPRVVAVSLLLALVTATFFYLHQESGDVARRTAAMINDLGSGDERVVIIGKRNMANMARFYLGKPIIKAEVGDTKRADHSGEFGSGPKIRKKFQGVWILMDETAMINISITGDQVFDAVEFVEMTGHRFPDREEFNLRGHHLIHLWKDPMATTQHGDPSRDD